MLRSSQSNTKMDKKSKCVPNSLCCPKRPELQRPLSSPALVAISGYDKYERQVNNKGYLPNLLETTLLHQIFVSWVRDFKFWLLAHFLIFFNYAKFQKEWTTFILDIIQGSPFEFLVDYKNKKHQRGTLIKCLISRLSNLAETLHS